MKRPEGSWLFWVFLSKGPWYKEVRHG